MNKVNTSRGARDTERKTKKLLKKKGKGKEFFPNLRFKKIAPPPTKKIKGKIRKRFKKISV